MTGTADDQAMAPVTLLLLQGRTLHESESYSGVWSCKAADRQEEGQYGDCFPFCRKEEEEPEFVKDEDGGYLDQT